MRALTAGLPLVTETKPFAHTVYLDAGGNPLGVELGARHNTFGGTDRLSMSVQPAAIRFLETWAAHWPDAAIVGEGDRLATAAFLDALDGTVVWLDTPKAEAATRRVLRGSTQSSAWLKGRYTKVRRLAESRPHVRLDGTLPVPELVEAAVAQVPAFAALAGAWSIL